MIQTQADDALKRRDQSHGWQTTYGADVHLPDPTGGGNGRKTSTLTTFALNLTLGHQTVRFTSTDQPSGYFISKLHLNPLFTILSSITMINPTIFLSAE